MECTNCGQQNAEGARFCIKCGVVLPINSSHLAEPRQHADHLGRFMLAC